MKENEKDAKLIDKDVKPSPKPGKPKGSGNSRRKGGKSRGNRGNSGKPKGKDERPLEDMRKPNGNDVNDYVPNQELLDSTASLPWSTITGITYHKESQYITDDGTAATNAVDFTSPGILSVRVDPTVGAEELDIDAVDVAAHSINLFTRSQNSGSTNYDAPDQMQFILAMDWVFMFINWFQRLIATMQKFNLNNRYTPKALIEMQGVDYDDFEKNYKQLTADINFYILQASTLSVPDTLPIFKRHSGLFKTYYLEGDSDKDQIYMFTPVCFRRLTLNSSPKRAELTRVPIFVNGGTRMTGDVIPLGSDTNHRMKADDIRQLAHDLLRPLYTNQDFATMSGDMRKAFGESRMITMNLFKDDAPIQFEKNDEILLMIKNSNTVSAIGNQYYFGATYKTGATTDSDFGDILQDPNTNTIYLQNQCNTTTLNSAEYYDEAYTNMMQLTLSGQPSKEMNMLLTRLKCYGKVHASGGFTHTFIYCSHVIPVVYEMCLDIDPFIAVPFRNEIMWIDTVGIMYAAQRLAQLSLISAFKYAPKVRFSFLDSTDHDKIKYKSTFWQVDNFTFLDTHDLDYLNSVAILGLLNVPHVALTSRNK